MSDITVIMPTSPIPSHPSTAILEETIDSVRHHLPDAEIFLQFDGVSYRTTELREDYEEYIRQALWLADHRWGNICPFVFDGWHHQSGMMLETLLEVETPLVLYVEHDAPLVTDESIDWKFVSKTITAGTSDLIRFHHEAVIPQDHWPLMHGWEPNHGCWLMRTSQWSQRPHLASAAFYRRLMLSHFNPGTPEFIEDRMYSVTTTAWREHRQMGWQQYRLHIYNPDPLNNKNMKRSYHLDGRKTGV